MARPPRPSARAGRVRRRTVLLLLFGALAIVAATLGVQAWNLWRGEPDHWAAYRSFIAGRSEPELTELANHIEHAVLPQWSAPIDPNARMFDTRADEPRRPGQRTISASYEQINAWLAVKLERYLRNQGAAMPDEVRAVAVAQREGQLVVSLDVDSPDLKQILSAHLRFIDADDLRAAGDDAAEDGTYLRVDRIVGGRLRLPTGQLINQLRQRLPTDDPGLIAILDAVAGDKPVGPIVLPVDGRRRARLLSVDPGDRQLSVDIQVFDPDRETEIKVPAEAAP